MKVFELRYTGSVRIGDISARGPAPNGLGLEEVSK